MEARKNWSYHLVVWHEISWMHLKREKKNRILHALSYFAVALIIFVYAVMQQQIPKKLLLCEACRRIYWHSLFQRQQTMRKPKWELYLGTLLYLDIERERLRSSFIEDNHPKFVHNARHPIPIGGSWQILQPGQEWRKYPVFQVSWTKSKST